MNPEANLKIVQQAYATFQRGDIAGTIGLMAKNVEWILPQIPNVPQSGKRHGVDQVREFFGLVNEVQEVQQFEPREFVAQGDKVVALGQYKWRVKKTGKTYSSEFAHVFTIKEGKVVRFQEFADSFAVAQGFV